MTDSVLPPPIRRKGVPIDPTALRLARIHAGLSIAELADRAGLTDATLYRIENGDHQPRVSTVNKLTKALGITNADLVPVPKADAPAADEALTSWVAQTLARAPELSEETAAAVGRLIFGGREEAAV